MEHELTHILVMDDDPDILELLRDTLVDEGYTVVTARSIVSALVALQSQPFDCILTDKLWFVTPDRRIRDLRQIVADTGSATVVLLTTYGPAARWVPAQLGLADIVVKPIDLRELLDLVHVVVQHSGRPA
jgi:DNA-binding NtrC family response regulator